MKDKLLAMAMPDGSIWGVPLMMIAEDRAKNYADEFGGDIQRSLEEDTLPLFASNPYAISEWAEGNMNWSDFDGHQVQLKGPDAPDFDKAWQEKLKHIVTPKTA